MRVLFFILIVTATAGVAAQVRSDDGAPDQAAAEPSNGTAGREAQGTDAAPPPSPVRTDEQGSGETQATPPVVVPSAGAGDSRVDPFAPPGSSQPASLFPQSTPFSDPLRTPPGATPSGGGAGPVSARPPDVSASPQAGGAAGGLSAAAGRPCGAGEGGTPAGGGSAGSGTASQGVGVSASQFQQPGVAADKFERPGVSAAQLAALLPGAKPATCSPAQDAPLYTAPANQPQPRIELSEDEPR